MIALSKHCSWNENREKKMTRSYCAKPFSLHFKIITGHFWSMSQSTSTRNKFHTHICDLHIPSILPFVFSPNFFPFACEVVSFFCKHSDYFHRFQWPDPLRRTTLPSTVSFQAFGFKPNYLSCADIALNLTFEPELNCARTAHFWTCWKLRKFHLTEKLFSAPLIGTFRKWESSSLRKLSGSLQAGIVRWICVCMTGVNSPLCVFCGLKQLISINFWTL